MVRKDSLDVVVRQFNGSLDEGTISLVRETRGYKVIHIVGETSDLININESKSCLDVIYLLISFGNHFHEFFDVNGVKHSGVVFSNILLVEESQYLVSVEVRVSFCHQGTFRN